MSKIKIKRVINFIFVILFLFSYLGLFGGVGLVKASSGALYLSPSTGSFKVGQTFSVKVQINSGDNQINAAEGKIKFNPEELEVKSISHQNSIFNLWIQEPNFSNSSGEINFSGGTTKPFQGTQGTIFSFTLQTKRPGTSPLKFSFGRVLAADEKGTDIQAKLISASYLVQSSEEKKEEESSSSKMGNSNPFTPISSSKKTPAAPIITSLTHPDSEKWYSQNTAKFIWKVPSDVQAVKLLVGHKPIASPTVYYSPPITSKVINDLDDGVWYFHIQFKNKYGWGEITHYKFQIDTQPPQPFKIKVKEGRVTDNPKPTLLFKSIDKTSGIDHYEIKIDDKKSLEEKEKSEYQLPLLSSGNHLIIVKAVDKAGNYTSSAIEIKILPVESPKIISYPQELLSKELLSVKGKAKPGIKVVLYYQKDKGKIRKIQLKADKNGNWFYQSKEGLSPGKYYLWAEAVNQYGAKSKSTKKVTFFVRSLGVSFSKRKIFPILPYLFLAIISLTILLLQLAKKPKRRGIKVKVKEKKDKEIEMIKKNLAVLEKGIKDEINRLKKKTRLSKGEKEILNHLKDLWQEIRKK